MINIDRAKEFAFSKVGKQIVDSDAEWILQFAADFSAQENARLTSALEAVTAEIKRIRDEADQVGTFEPNGDYYLGRGKAAAEIQGVLNAENAKAAIGSGVTK